VVGWSHRLLWQAPAQAENAEQAALGRLFHIGALGALVAGIVATANNLVAGQPVEAALAGTGSALILALIAAARRGHLRFASAVLPTIGTAFLITFALLRDGTHDGAMLALVVNVVIAGVMMSGRGLVGLVALINAAILAMGYAETTGLIHNRFAAFTDFRSLIGLCLSIDTTAFVVRALASILIGRVREASSARERLELAVQASRSLVWEWDIVGGAVLFERNGLGLPGLDGTTIRADVSQLERWVHGDDIPALDQALRNAVKGLAPDFVHEFRVRRDGDAWLWVLTRGRVVERDSRGYALRMTGITLDIDERKNAEHRLQRSEERFARMIDASPAATVIGRLDDGVFVEANRAAQRLFGYRRDEMIGSTALKLGMWAEPDDRAKLFDSLQADEPVILRPATVRRKSGETRDLLISAACFESEGEALFLTSAVDITDAKRARELQQHSEERFAKVFDASPNAISITRLRDGKYLEVNKAWLDLAGYTRNEVIGHTAQDIGIWLDPRDRERFIERIRAHGAVRNHEARLRRKSGPIMDVVLCAEVVEIAGEPHLIVPFIDVTDRRQAEERIQHLATRDALTGLPNRLLFTDRVSLAIGKAQWNDGSVALLVIDLDRFKYINDSLGHAFGDAFLRAVAERLSGVVGKKDALARLGGDEFAVVLENVAPVEDAAGQLARRILAAFREPFCVEGQSLICSCSIGISVFPPDSADPQLLIRDAETAMYDVKESGRAAYRYFSSVMNSRMQERLQIESGLRDAIRGRHFELVYQPKVQVASGRVTGYEALLRWRHPSWGLVSPTRFIGVAEDTGLIVEIGRWVIEEVCRQIREWRRRGLPPLPVSVNLSVRQFLSNLVDETSATMRRFGVDPGLIDLEITESLFMQNPEQVATILRDLSRLGANVTLDDFGTGYSSLGYIRQFNLNALKIDRSFISGISATSQNVAIVRAVIMMCRGLGIRVVAEGVETKEQLDILRTLGCDEYQGFLFSPPVAADEIERRHRKAALGA